MKVTLNVRSIMSVSPAFLLSFRFRGRCCDSSRFSAYTPSCITRMLSLKNTESPSYMPAFSAGLQFACTCMILWNPSGSEASSCSSSCLTPFSSRYRQTQGRSQLLVSSCVAREQCPGGSLLLLIACIYDIPFTILREQSLPTCHHLVFCLPAVGLLPPRYLSVYPLNLSLYRMVYVLY